MGSTYHHRLTGWVGDAVDQVTPHLFADADFAGDPKTSRSTSEMQLCLLGPNTIFPLAGVRRLLGDRYCPLSFVLFRVFAAS